MGTTNHAVDTMIRKYTMRVVHDPHHDDYEWPEGVEMHTWGTRTITDVGGRVGDLRDYVSYYGRQGQRDVTKAFFVTVADHYEWEYTLADSFARANGVIHIPTGDDGYTDPRVAAKMILAEYRQWANGETYGFVIEDDQGSEVESCWGMIGEDVAEAEGTATLNWLTSQAAKVVS